MHGIELGKRLSGCYMPSGHVTKVTNSLRDSMLYKSELRIQNAAISFMVHPLHASFVSLDTAIERNTIWRTL